MLKSNAFVERLLKVVCSDGESRNHVAQGLALDILIWIASVRLGRYRSAKGEVSLLICLLFCLGCLIALTVTGFSRSNSQNL